MDDRFNTIAGWVLFAGIIALGVANFIVLFETKRRRHAETDLVEANQSLEKRVEERTDELKKANESLRESELFKRSVIDSLSAHIAVLDKDGKIILVVNYRGWLAWATPSP